MPAKSFPATTQLLIVTVLRSLKTPPKRPFDTVRPEIVTFGPFAVLFDMVIVGKLTVPPTVLRCTFNTFAPEPLIVRSVARSRELFKLMVQTPTMQPGSPPGMLKLIVFGSLNKLAALIASRREQCEARHDPMSSAVVLTTRVGSARVQSEKELTLLRIAKWLLGSLVFIGTLGVNCVKLPLDLKIL